MLDVQPAGSDDATSLKAKLGIATIEPAAMFYSLSHVGAVMTVHIFEGNPPHESAPKLYCLVGYEDGSVSLYCRDEGATIKTIEGKGWTQLWRRREHTESGKVHQDAHIKT
jgi:hypothetical protein